MTQRVWVAAILLAVVVGRARTMARPPQDEETRATLAAAAKYVDAYEKQAVGLVAEEDYFQQATGGEDLRRHLKSDIIVSPHPVRGWIEFRSVFQVDGKTIQDRNATATALMKTPATDALEEATRIANESARYNIDAPGMPAVVRTINLPLLALAVLRRDNQLRGSVLHLRDEVIDGRNLAVFAFQENSTPRLIRSDNDAALFGQFWIEPESGRVYQTQLVMTTVTATSRTTAAVRVEYAFNDKVDMLVPVRMDEGYDLSVVDPSIRPDMPVTAAGPMAQMERTGRIRCTATYSNFRRFTTGGRVIMPFN